MVGKGGNLDSSMVHCVLRGLSMENRESHFIIDMNLLGYIKKTAKKWVSIGSFPGWSFGPGDVFQGYLD